MALRKQDPNAELADFIGTYYANPAGYIMNAYEWGVKGSPLERFDGPEPWVLDVCKDIASQVKKNKFNGVDPVATIEIGIASGNGAAKSAFAGMLNSWILDTRPDSKGSVLANTGAQLKAKTWTEIKKWKRLAITSHWWIIGEESIRHITAGDDWSVHKVTWDLKNPTAVAGQHSRTGSSYYIWDECVRIPEAIFNEADGGLTDGEPFWIMLGNMTVRRGRLYEKVFGRLRWNGSGSPPLGQPITRTVDIRECKYTNKQKIEQWIRERGIDSDWVRAHVLGLAPNAGDLQFIDEERVRAARIRPVPPSDTNESLIMSIDFARGGKAWNIVGYRRGRDARSIPRLRVPGELTRDTTKMVSLISEQVIGKKPDVIFGDATGVGGPIMDRLRQLFPNVPIIDVINGGKPPDDLPNRPSKYADWRAYCWSKMKEWLVGGCIEDDEKLETDLVTPEYWHDKRDRLRLESKEDIAKDDEEGGEGIPSPDDGDQLAMTFAQPVAPRQTAKRAPVEMPDIRPTNNFGGKGWMRR